MDKSSHSQLGQDLWVLDRTGNKRNGFFVEAGVCDGMELSNTLLLEQDYAWTGICCEPNPAYFSDLEKNRSCSLDAGVLYDEDGVVIDFYTAGPAGGTKADFQQEPARKSRRESAQVVKAKTIKLNTLLEKHQAPHQIDYISLDTEGSELRILSAFDFRRWEVKIFSVEHNTQHRDDGSAYIDALVDLMSGHGYKFEPNKWDAYFYR